MDTFSERIQGLSVQLVPFIMAVVFHEFAHGWMALKWGDPTAKDQGRLTLNPIPHLDPIGTLAIPILNMVSGINFLIGWARPVPINPTRFKKYKPGMFWVSLAGPGMNMVLGVGSAIMLCTFIFLIPETFFLHRPLTMMAKASLELNFALAVFNLLPLPPLDGAKILSVFLSYQANQKFEELGNYSFYIFLALMFSGAFRILFYPVAFLSQATLFFVMQVFQIFMGGQ